MLIRCSYPDEIFVADQTSAFESRDGAAVHRCQARIEARRSKHGAVKHAAALNVRRVLMLSNDDLARVQLRPCLPRGLPFRCRCCVRIVHNRTYKIDASRQLSETGTSPGGCICDSSSGDAEIFPINTPLSRC